MRTGILLVLAALLATPSAFAFSGRVTKIDSRGWGYIRPQDGGKDLFFHVTGIKRGVDIHHMREGICVTYHLDNSGGSVKAIAVEIDDYNDCDQYDKR